jgi:quinol-cytochrome oxidoreductase complex cytochrome b subunit/cytochrome c1
MTSSAPKQKFDNKTVQWINDRLPIFSMLQNEYGKFPTPKNFNYFWNFGAIAMCMLGIMIASGIFLAMNYVPNGSMAFESVEHMTRDVNYGWLMRYIHMNGASFFFIAVYIHIFRGIFYGSYRAPRELVWIFGVVIMLLMMATAFMGYALPWSQMSGWGTTVITSLFSAIPLAGNDITTWLWGGFTVGNPTLNRFYALHFLLPFVICAVVFVHVWALHVTGSNNPTGVEPKSEKDTIPFHPYYTTKDSFGTVVFLIFFFAVAFFAPLQLAEPDHFKQFDPMQTPPHIVPEWYFLPFYAILRSFTVDIQLIPFTHLLTLTAKLQGVIAMFGSIILLFFLPWLDSSPVRSARYRPVYKVCVLLLVVAMGCLTYAGGQLPQGWPVVVGRVATFYYFFHFLVIVPILGSAKLPQPKDGFCGFVYRPVYNALHGLSIVRTLRQLDTSVAVPNSISEAVEACARACKHVLIPAALAITLAATPAHAGFTQPAYAANDDDSATADTAQPAKADATTTSQTGTAQQAQPATAAMPVSSPDEDAAAKADAPDAAATTGDTATQAAPANAPQDNGQAAAQDVTKTAPTAVPASVGTAAGEEGLAHQSWPDDGVFGHYDKAALQRGFQIYKEVCSACHSMKFVSYRNLADLGYSADQIKSLAATVTITDGPDDSGNMVDRPGKPSDHFKSPFKNEQAARAANGGALPPDMSLLVKAREGGEDYVYGILTGYGAAPAGVTLMPGLNYNKTFPGHQIAMPQPLIDGRVTFADGTPNTLAQEARDVSQFLAWASEPKMEERKRMGLKVILFMLVFAGILFNTKKKVWGNRH